MHARAPALKVTRDPPEGRSFYIDMNVNAGLRQGAPAADADVLYLPLQALADLRMAISCAPTHISWYQLTIEPNTEFFRRPPVLPHDDAIVSAASMSA